jgi:DNA replication protein DnaC
MNIKENCKILKLSYIFKNYEEEIKEAKQTKKDVGIFLDELLEKEINQRKENGVKKRIRYAKFPIKKYLEDFDRKKYKQEFIKEFEELETLEFIDKKENIILIRYTWCRKNTLCNRFGH